jgi:hypothetical protein
VGKAFDPLQGRGEFRPDFQESLLSPALDHTHLIQAKGAYFLPPEVVTACFPFSSITRAGQENPG